MNDIEMSCPLGAECEEIKDNKVHRCKWYVALRGKDPQSDKEIDDWQCAMYWLPILMIENAQTNRGQTAAIESFRNEMVNNNNNFNELLSGMGTQLEHKD